MVFPSPVGGTILPIDFAPSLVVTILYGLLLPFFCYRLYDRKSRTLMMVGTFCFMVEHIILFAFRTKGSKSASAPTSAAFNTWMQVDFALGFIGVSGDLLNLLRCLLLNSTYGRETYHQNLEMESRNWSHRYEPEIPDLPEGAEDHPKRRFFIRRFFDAVGLAYIAAFIPGLIANSQYFAAITDTSKAEQVARLRYASTGVAFLLTIIVTGLALWGCTIPRVERRVALLFATLSTLTTVIALYRLSILHNDTDALDSMAPGSLNSAKDKALFYIFHLIPEWLVSFALLGLNIRQLSGCGFFGDWRWQDETPKEKAKREVQDTKRAEKRRLRIAERERKEQGKLVPRATAAVLEADMNSVEQGTLVS